MPLGRFLPLDHQAINLSAYFCRPIGNTPTGNGRSRTSATRATASRATATLRPQFLTFVPTLRIGARGIEPPSSDRKSNMLTVTPRSLLYLCYCWRGRRDLNPPPLDRQSRMQTATPRPHFQILLLRFQKGTEGIEPSTSAFAKLHAIRCATFPLPIIVNTTNSHAQFKFQPKNKKPAVEIFSTAGWIGLKILLW